MGAVTPYTNSFFGPHASRCAEGVQRKRELWDERVVVVFLVALQPSAASGGARVQAFGPLSVPAYRVEGLEAKHSGVLSYFIAHCNPRSIMSRSHSAFIQPLSSCRCPFSQHDKVDDQDDTAGERWLPPSLQLASLLPASIGPSFW
jgi:hypothetical protein